MTTRIDIDELERVAKAATPGPYDVEHDRNDQPCIYAGPDNWIALLPHQCVTSLEVQANADAAFIALANPTTVLALIARVRELEAGLGEACGANGTFPTWDRAYELRALATASRSNESGWAVDATSGIAEPTKEQVDAFLMREMGAANRQLRAALREALDGWEAVDDASDATLRKPRIAELRELLVPTR